MLTSTHPHACTHRFLVNRMGIPVKRYGPSFDQAELEADIERLLAE